MLKLNLLIEHSLSGRDVKKRQQQLQTKLHEEFEECSGKEVLQKSVLHFLGLSEDNKSLATRAVTAAFPLCQLRRVRRKGENLYPFIQFN